VRNQIQTLLLVAIPMLFSLCIAFIMSQSTAPLETGDGISHYQIASYSWTHPHLLLDHWGKPLFTLLSSSFAQLGIAGMTIFNVLCALPTFYLLLRIGRQLEIKRLWLALLILACAPIYFKSVLSGLTEVLFALALVYCVDRLLAGRYILAIMVASFLPYIRPEAYLVIPFILAYVLRFQWRATPFILVGSLIYSVWGYLALGDFLWMITDDPYIGAADGVYGYGPWNSFINRAKNIAGIPISILFIALTVAVPLFWLKRPPQSKNKAGFRWALLLLMVTSVFCVHSFLWWKGMHGSLGLLRVVSTVMPIVAIMTAWGLDMLLENVRDTRWSTGFLFFFGGLMIYTLIDRVPWKVEYKAKEQLTVQAAHWIQAEYGDRKQYYLDPILALEQDLDVYDLARCDKLWSMDETQPSNSMQSGEIIVWDTHYGPNEGKICMPCALEDPQLNLIKEFRPEEPIIIFGDREYAIYVLERE
jgi:hypothetical protein